MARPDPLLLDTARKLFRAVADPQARRAGDDEATRRAAWQAIEDSGLTRAWIAESAGGAGASIVDGFAILTAAGEVALDVPLAETLLASWLLASAALAVPGGKLVPIAGAGVEILDGRLRGRASRVAFAREADRLVVCGVRGSAGFVALVDRAACRVEPHDNLAGEPRDTVVLDGVAPAALAVIALFLEPWLDLMGATARACQMAGALGAILARSVASSWWRVGVFSMANRAASRTATRAATSTWFSSMPGAWSRHSNRHPCRPTPRRVSWQQWSWRLDP